MAPLLAHKRSVDRTFERLYRHHALDVYRYAYGVLRNQADAEDVTQTTFLNAYRALERGDEPLAPHNWLIAIAHNVCRQRFRAAARRVQEVGLEEDIADHFVRPEDDDAPSPEDIRRAIGHLAFNQRAALVMRELEGRSYTEIAEVLGVTVSAVETLIFRARRALREQLEASLTCGQAEQLLSRQLDGELAKEDRSQLRAHLRQCESCRRLARSQRAQRSALKAFGAIPLPSSLASLLGGGAPLVAKVAAVVVTASVAGGIGYDVHHRLTAPTRGSINARRVLPAAHRAAPAPIIVPLAAAAVAVPASSTTVHHARAHHGERHVVQAHVERPARHAVHGAPVERPAAAELAHERQQQKPAKRPRPAEAGTQAPRTKPAHRSKPVHATQSVNGRSQEHPQPAGQDHPATAPPAAKGQNRGKNAETPPVQSAVPPVTTTVPVSEPDDLTQTSQIDGARNPLERHLHP